jgi:hypothetical protein
MYHPFVPQVIRVVPRSLSGRRFGAARKHAALTYTSNWQDERIDTAFRAHPSQRPDRRRFGCALEEPMIVALTERTILFAQRNENAPIPIAGARERNFHHLRKPTHDPGIHAIAFRAFPGGRLQSGGGPTRPSSRIDAQSRGGRVGVSFVPASLQRMHMIGVDLSRAQGRDKTLGAVKACIQARRPFGGRS